MVKGESQGKLVPLTWCSLLIIVFIVLDVFLVMIYFEVFVIFTMCLLLSDGIACFLLMKVHLKYMTYMVP